MTERLVAENEIETLRQKVTGFSLFGIICSFCDNITDEDMICDSCGEYVCEDCATKHTYMDPCERVECPTCRDGREMSYWNTDD